MGPLNLVDRIPFRDTIELEKRLSILCMSLCRANRMGMKKRIFQVPIEAEVKEAL